MKRFFRDTIFFRLFSLVLAALIISHLATVALVAVSFQFHEQYHEEPVNIVRMGAKKPSIVFMDRGFPPHPPRSENFPHPPGMPIGLLIGMATQFLALLVAAWFGARILARPIQRLGKAAAQLGNGIGAPMIEEEGPQEARGAAKAFNQMQARIRAQMEERSRFLAAVSHDLRTPLTRMKLRMERADEAVPREKLLADIEEMSAMLNGTLNYFRGAASIEMPQLLDVQALVESMAEDAVDNGSHVTLKGTAEAITTLPLALRRCLTNLLVNALRYGESAEIILEDSPKELTIHIQDNGPGIPVDKLEAVFEPFVRLEASRNKSTGGVGLGLAIAKDSANQCGGQLSLKNADGGGLIASVRLPREVIV